MVLLTLLYLWKGVANIEIGEIKFWCLVWAFRRLLVEECFFPSSLMVQTRCFKLEKVLLLWLYRRYHVSSAINLAMMYCLSFSVCTVLAHFFTFTIMFIPSPQTGMDTSAVVCFGSSLNPFLSPSSTSISLERRWGGGAKKNKCWAKKYF